MKRKKRNLYDERTPCPKCGTKLPNYFDHTSIACCLDNRIAKWEGGERIDANALLRDLIRIYRRPKIEDII